MARIMNTSAFRPLEQWEVDLVAGGDGGDGGEVIVYGGYGGGGGGGYGGWAPGGGGYGGYGGYGGDGGGGGGGPPSPPTPADSDSVDVDDSKLTQPLTPEQIADKAELKSVLHKYEEAIKSLPDNAVLHMPNGIVNGVQQYVDVTGAELKAAFANADAFLLDVGSSFYGGAKFAMDWNSGDPKILVALDGLRDAISQGRLSETIGHEIGHMTPFNRANWDAARSDGVTTADELSTNQFNATRLGWSLQVLMGEDMSAQTGTPSWNNQPSWQMPDNGGGDGGGDGGGGGGGGGGYGGYQIP